MDKRDDGHIDRARQSLEEATRELVRASESGDRLVRDAATQLARDVDHLRRRVRNLARLAGGVRGG